MPMKFTTSEDVLRLYNTLTRQKEVLLPSDGNVVRMYTCGPTVYNYAHIGNFRTYVFEDLLRRTIKFFGMQVCQVMNLTDVDDKTIKGAIEQGCSLNAYTQKYKDAFFEDLDALNIERVEHYPAATDYIPHMIRMIEVLIEKGIAYQGVDKSVYFSISKFPSYGALSHLNLSELKSGASQRLDTDEYEKDNVGDFVLWKAFDPERDGGIYWDSPFGRGRPGWHIECSAMATEILGKTLDIHVGGVDNMFPHHENEIAQSEACTGSCFSRLWMHSEHLIVNNRKMSKSLHNFYTLRDLLAKGYTGSQVRYLLLQTHYKTQLNFTLEALAAAKASLERLHDFTYRLRSIQQPEGKDIKPLLEKTHAAFAKALADDLNSSPALAVLFELVRQINTSMDANELGVSGAKDVLSLLERFDSVLGILEFSEEEAPRELQEMLEQRQQARAAKEWKQADILRDQILQAGYVIEDTPLGPRLKRQER